MPPPLKGIKVVDLTRVLAGPYATMMLSDLGADVIKIEHPQRGDDTRAWNPPSAPLLDRQAPTDDQHNQTKLRQQDWSKLPPESAYFLQANRGKRSLTLDLKHPKGLEIAHNLIKQADILVENYVPGKLAQLGLGYDDCKRINPKLIYASISGYGQQGPYSQNPGYDVIIEAEAGLMHITGEPDGKPVKVGVAITGESIHLTTGLYLKSAVLAALISRSQTGKGVWIDANLFESQIASLANIASNYLIAGQEAKRHGTAHPSIVPYEVLSTKDGFIMIAAGNDSQFVKLCRILERPSLSSDPAYSNNGARVTNRKQLISLLTEALSTRTTNEWLKKMKGSGFPFAPVNNIEQTFKHPQAIARQVVTEMKHPRAGKIKVLSPAVSYNNQKMKVTRPPPVLGQHTIEILRQDLNMSDDEIAQLQEQNVV
ncbi:hypothetical protein OIO90_005169 [Microbotryomycetes sp. JL221]|nr:hypothetical protein OIO90_005169 [Microbotryomycetes sp. JL221]